MGHCLFCKIISGEIPSHKVYEDEETVGFYDVNPQAPVHVLIIPKNHYPHIVAIDQEILLGKLMSAVQQVAQKLDVIDAGFRVVINTNQHGGQTVDHVHLHLLAGRQLSWPPG